MYVVTVYGYEDRAATRIQVGCESMARATQWAAQEVLGYTAIAKVDAEPDRSEEEIARAHRLTAELAPHIFGERV